MKFADTQKEKERKKMITNFMPNQVDNSVLVSLLSLLLLMQFVVFVLLSKFLRVAVVCMLNLACIHLFLLMDVTHCLTLNQSSSNNQVNPMSSINNFPNNQQNGLSHFLSHNSTNHSLTNSPFNPLQKLDF